MNKNIFTLSAIGFFLIALSICSCKQVIIDPYAYDVSKDTMAPVIAISVPTFNEVYSYGNDVAIVGTITDKESKKNDNLDPGYRAGKLKTLNITVENLNTNTLLLNKAPVVDGLDGIAFNEKFGILVGSGTTNCRLIIATSDYGGKSDRDTVLFSYQ